VYGYDGDTIVPVTPEINRVVRVGDVVDAEYITDATGIRPSGGWKYLSAKTFVEEDFPSDGLVIDE
jgi:hypothetical protein